MAYQVKLQQKNGPITDNFKMYNAPTPSPGDIIDVDTSYGMVRARVTDRTFAQPVDLVTAIEV
jgi:hypothetical protein